MTIMQLTPW